VYYWLNALHVDECRSWIAAAFCQVIDLSLVWCLARSMQRGSSSARIADQDIDLQENRHA
jgi:hypothetical protein